jgi:hypothetical protein
MVPLRRLLCVHVALLVDLEGARGRVSDANNSDAHTDTHQGDVAGASNVRRAPYHTHAHKRQRFVDLVQRRREGCREKAQA